MTSSVFRLRHRLAAERYPRRVARVSATVAVLLGASILASCSAQSSGVGSSAVLQVNDWKLKSAELDSMLNEFSQAQLISVSEEQRAELTTKMHGTDVAKKTWSSGFTAFVLNEAMQNQVIHEEFLSRKLPTPSLDTEERTQFVAALGGEEIYKKLPKAYRSATERRQAEFAAMNAASLKAVGTPEAYFAKNKAKFVQVCAAHILVDTEEEALSIKTKIDGGGDFAAIAKASSKDTGSGAAGGELGCADPAGFVPEFAAVTRTIELGKLSEPVKTQFGYHLIKVAKREAQPFDAVKATLDQQLKTEAADATSNKLIQRIKKAKLTVDPKFGQVQSAGEQGFPQIVAKKLPTDAVDPAAAAAVAEAAGLG